MINPPAFALFVSFSLMLHVRAAGDGSALSRASRNAKPAMRDGSVTLNGVRLHYLEWPKESAPAVLLIPGTGGPGSGRLWVPLAQTLQDRYRVLSIEPRGLGESDRAAEYSWQLSLKDVDAFIDHFSLAPVILIGHSTGAVWAYLYAADHPSKVARLVAVDSGLGAPLFQTEPLPPMRSFESQEEAVQFAKSRWHTHPSVGAVVRDWVAHGTRRLADGRWSWGLDPKLRESLVRDFGGHEELLREHLRRIRCPALVVRGASSTWPLDQARATVAAIRDAHLVEVLDSGHVVPLANPVGFAAAVGEFLAESSQTAQQAVDTAGCNQQAVDPISYVAVPGNPFLAMPTPDGCWIFVSLMRTNTPGQVGIAVLRRAGGTTALARVVPLQDSPRGMVLTHDGKLLIVAADSAVAFLDAARLISGEEGAVLGYLREGRPFYRIYVNVTRDDQLLFVSDERAQSITVVNLARARTSGFATTSVVGTIPVGLAPIALTFSPDERYLYTTSERVPERLGWPIACKSEGSNPATAAPPSPEGAIFVIDVARARTDPAKSVIATVRAGCSPVRLVTSPRGEVAYVSARNSDALLAFDTQKLLGDSAHALTSTVPVGRAPVGVAVIDRGRKVVVANSNRFAGTADDQASLAVVEVRKLSTGGAAVVATIPAGGFPRELRLTADERVLLVTNFSSRTVELVDLTRLP